MERIAPDLIHLVFKTHLDIGFTDHAEAVRQLYHDRFIPQALTTAEHFWQEDWTNPAFIWTTGAWLVHDHLAQGSAAQVTRLERAIERGLIRWHALPFTTHSELMSPALFRAGLSYSQDLDARFGVTTRAAKMTDVPGHTIGIVPLLAAAGVRFLHLGVNTACPVPDVPDLFRWRAADGSEIVVMYQNSYGATHLPEGMTEALSFAHTNDNLGPQSVPQTVEVYRGLAEAYPGARIRAGTLDEYGARLWDRRETLPVIETEIGDSWIHGCASDPAKLARFRVLQRLFDRFEGERLTPERRAFGRRLCMVAEHTWGVDIKSYLRDEEAWDRAEFEEVRDRDDGFAFTEASWDEQRRYLDTAVRELAPEDRDRAEAELARLSAPPRIEGIRGGVQAAAGWQITPDRETGDISRLTMPDGFRIEGRDGGPLLGVTHRSFDASDMQRHLDSYLTNRPGWAILDHGKPGLERAKTARSAEFRPAFDDWATNGAEVEIVGRMADDAHSELGAPARYRWHVTPMDADCLSITLVVENKRANRMPEAGFVTFDPEGVTGWEVLKMGHWLDPAQTVARGGGALHGLFAARCQSGPVALHITPLDIGLCAPKGHDLMDFGARSPVWNKGLGFLAYTNKWGTNFPMWWSGTLAFRFIMRVEAT